MTQMRAHHDHRDPRQRQGELNLLSVALLLVALVAIALVLIGVARSGTSPAWVLPPLAFAIWNILTLRR